MAKHILCVHPCGAGQMVGDEKIVSDTEWAGIKDQMAGPYKIWMLKRDMGTDHAGDETPEADPTHEAVLLAENNMNPEVEARKVASKRAVKAGERAELPEATSTDNASQA